MAAPTRLTTSSPCLLVYSLCMFTILPQFLIPVMHFQWEGTNNCSQARGRVLWRLLVPATRLGGRYKPKFEKCYDPYFAPKTQKWRSVHFQLEYVWIDVWHKMSQHPCVRWVGFKRPPVGNHLLRVQWSRDRQRLMTAEDQGHDPKIFEAPYVEKCTRYTLIYSGSYWSPMGNLVSRDKWSRD